MLFKSDIYQPSVRKRKAYFTAFQVFFSYYWLIWKSKIRGKAYYNKHIRALHIKNANRIQLRVQELQGLFIKLGQLVSNLSNVLPNEFREPLESLQDKIQAKPFSEIENTLFSELGKPYNEIFTDFNREPIAAASIGQVHRAIYQGKEVIVKIQHQNIDVIAAADLQILKNLVKLHALFMDMYGLDHTYEQVKLMIEEELDYRIEGKAMQEIAANLKSAPDLGVKVPVLYTELNTRKILVAEYYEGLKTSNIKGLQNWNLDLEDIARRLIDMYCKMVLVDGFYHADPHPGNILINEAGEIILLDFGATAKLSQSTKEAIPELIEALVKNDTSETVIALRKLGFLGSDKDSKKFVEKLLNIFKEFLENEVEFDGLNFQNIKLNSGLSSLSSLLMKIDLRDISNNIRIPKEYILLNRTIVLLLGNTFALAPQLNALNVVRPYIKENLLNQKEDFISIITGAVKNQIATAISLPKELSSFLKNAEQQDIYDEVKGIRLLLGKLYRLGKVFFFSLILILSVLALKQNNFHLLLKVVNWLFIVVSGFYLIQSFLRKPN